MTSKKRTLLQNPTGTEAFYLEEAYRHRRITSSLDKLFTSWGYLPVETPVFDFYDIYASFLTEGQDSVYRLIDRDGDLLMLRSDVTLFLAKQMGRSLKSSDLPVRVSYSDTILRYQDSEDISRNEFFQAGAELIGKEGIEGDTEIVLLLLSTIKTLEIEAYIHIGSRALFNAVFCQFDEKEKQKLLKAVRGRYLIDMRDSLQGVWSDEAIEYLNTLFTFIGEKKEFDALIRKGKPFLTPSILAELKAIPELTERVRELAPEANIRIDLSEVGGQPYYTGLVFQAYMEGMDSAIAGGGRYDNLLKGFGFDSPSVGFSILLRKIESRLGKSGRFSLPAAIVTAEGKTFAERYKNAEEQRKKGRIVIL